MISIHNTNFLARGGAYYTHKTHKLGYPQGIYKIIIEWVYYKCY